MKKLRFYHRVEFWIKLEKQLAYLSGITLGALGIEHAPYWTFTALAVAGLIAKSIFIWIEDKNNDGIVDAWQSEEDLKVLIAQEKLKTES